MKIPQNQEVRVDGNDSKLIVDITAASVQAPRADDEDGLWAELRMKSWGITLPCATLHLCPYGRLREAFPADADEAASLGMSDHRLPIPCGLSGRHCPVHYLAGRVGDYDHTATCWDTNATPDCSGCEKRTDDACPSELVAERTDRIRAEAADLRSGELADYVESGEMGFDTATKLMRVALGVDDPEPGADDDE